ncbi:hypothetical protein ETU10_08740 [Apibacter muscae]|uniref:hypothetical protein n=1 Tax=Apibacter muscae TaxID=2509004 RepID=UPI0011ABAC51|nr:hypothetical protein [Apibacter muscae]TWP23050.1 hypothetical protein ETU10_08740 [Apibacter muscae]
MNIAIYNSKTGFKKEWEEENSLPKVIEIYQDIPNISGCFLDLRKEDFKLKIQVINEKYYRYILFYKNKSSAFFLEKSMGKRILDFFIKDELSFIFYLNNPKKLLPEQENIEIKEKEIKQNIIYKTHKGKTYTQEEWAEFEQKQFESYAHKHNIPLEKDKPKKSFGFFLDEKDCEY